MITPFLKQAATYVFEQHNEGGISFEKICVVLPTRRAVLFFKKYLALQTSQPILSPEVLAIEDFVLKAVGLQQIEPIALVLLLHDTLKEIDASLDFDRFVSYASIILQDFDRVDLYMGNAQQLFDYLSEAKTLERWNVSYYASAKQQKTEIQDRYFALFANLKQLYLNFRERLLLEGNAYRGMAYRLLAEKTEEYLITPDRYRKFYFVGFNAFSTSEEEMVYKLVKLGKAETLWDSDDFYMKNTAMEAGKLLRKYKRIARFGGERLWHWQSDFLAGPSKIKQATLTDDEAKCYQKSFKIVGVANNSLQPLVAGQLVKQWQLADSKPSTAIVLGDETLLMPTLYAIDDAVQHINVTMGVSLHGSPIYTLIEALFEMQSNLVEFRSKENRELKIPMFHYRHIQHILEHPFIKHYEAVIYSKGNSPFATIAFQIKEQQLVFLNENQLVEYSQNDDLFLAFFTRWKHSSKQAIEQLRLLVDKLIDTYLPIADAIENEYLYLFRCLLQRLEGVFENRKEVSIRNFRNFLLELIRQTKIPFTGEPEDSLQVMGMLETRTLDFDRIVLLSVNEGVLPQGKRQNSLIPHDAAIEFGLPTHGEQDAVMAYHFFRLLQRAKEVYFVYTVPSVGKEKSRFLLQIEHELVRQNPFISLSFPVVELLGEVPEHLAAETISIIKTPTILAYLRQKMAKNGLYASHLNDYLQCSLKYYFQQIADVGDDDSLDESLAADQFGNWLHKTLENIDRDFSLKNRTISEQDFLQIIHEIPERLSVGFGETYQNLQLEAGMNQILFRVAEKLLVDFFKQQMLDNESNPLEVIGFEKKIQTNVTFTIAGEEIAVKIAGRIDRLERRKGILRVVDYKTGKVEKKQLESKATTTVESMILHDIEAKHIRQLWLYKYLVVKQLEKESNSLGFKPENIEAGIYSFRNQQEGFLVAELTFEGEDFVMKTEELLRVFMVGMLNSELPFEGTQNHATCQYCSYKNICGRA